jgi:hypothetical protein
LAACRSSHLWPWVSWAAAPPPPPPAHAGRKERPLPLQPADTVPLSRSHRQGGYMPDAHGSSATWRQRQRQVEMTSAVGSGRERARTCPCAPNFSARRRAGQHRRGRRLAGIYSPPACRPAPRRATTSSDRHATGRSAAAAACAACGVVSGTTHRRELQGENEHMRSEVEKASG